MSEDDVLELLRGKREVIESYVLVRHIKLYLNLDQESFHPKLEIKIWKSEVNSRFPFHFTVSHHVRTPSQAGPYRASLTSWENEKLAIYEAISTTTKFLKAAIAEGHEPSDDWLIADKDF